MPSPIAHTTMGYITYRVVRRFVPGQSKPRPFSLPLIAVLIFSMLPDVDAVFGLISGDLSKYHNNGTHSLITGLGAALIFAGLLRVVFHSRFAGWFLFLWLGYGMHVVLDFFTAGGRGVMLFWPLLDTRFQSPISLFYGVRWSSGIGSGEHLLTIASELVFSLTALFILNRFERKGQLEQKPAAR